MQKYKSFELLKKLPSEFLKAEEKDFPILGRSKKFEKFFEYLDLQNIKQNRFIQIGHSIGIFSTVPTIETIAYVSTLLTRINETQEKYWESTGLLSRYPKLRHYQNIIIIMNSSAELLSAWESVISPDKLRGMISTTHGMYTIYNLEAASILEDECPQVCDDLTTYSIIHESSHTMWEYLRMLIGQQQGYKVSEIYGTWKQPFEMQNLYWEGAADEIAMQYTTIYPFFTERASAIEFDDNEIAMCIANPQKVLPEFTRCKYPRHIETYKPFVYDENYSKLWAKIHTVPKVKTFGETILNHMQQDALFGYKKEFGDIK